MTTLHPETFDYLRPTLAQTADMNAMRVAAADYARAIDILVPEGPDKTYILRRLREVAMWVNVSITRNSDGSPRQEHGNPLVKEYPADHPAPGDLGSIPL